jgi:hypothetical protein
MTIVTHYVDHADQWYAYDEDTYDGAEDAGRRARTVGWGKTEAEAIADLKEQLDEYAEVRVIPTGNNLAPTPQNVSDREHG